MLFNSVDYLLFFPIVYLIFNLITPKYRLYVLLSASIYFYSSWQFNYIYLILFSSIIDYLASIFIERSRSHKNFFLLISLISNLGLLAFFKYYNFFIENLNGFFLYIFKYNLNLSPHNYAFPVGISFYTFQTLGYTIDVYRGKTRPEKNFLVYLTYVLFFPQLIAGPIERASHLIFQLRSSNKPRSFKMNNILTGFELILWGMFKKVVLADNLSTLIVDIYYNNLSQVDAFSTLVSIFSFSIQIYCDFSGYTDIARGSARILNIELIKNFDSPYLSRSIKEFWRRWHISLSYWFRDYIYIPLGGNKYIRNIVIVFLLSGLWHGAKWKFVFWGGLHAFCILTERFWLIKTEKKIEVKNLINFSKLWNSAITFMLVSFMWVFFRANSIDESFQVFKSLSILNVAINKSLLWQQNRWILLLFLLSFLMIWVEAYYFKLRRLLVKSSIYFRLLIYFIAMFVILILGRFDTNEFIYFDF